MCIRDRLLAISSPVESVWASPPDVEITAEKTKQIASLLGIAPTDISKKLVNTEREFVYLKRRLPPELAAQVMKVGVPGIYLQREYKRYYPAGEVTAHLVGFTSVDDKGQEGYELAMNAFLSGCLLYTSFLPICSKISIPTVPCPSTINL